MAAYPEASSCDPSGSQAQGKDQGWEYDENYGSNQDLAIAVAVESGVFGRRRDLRN